MRLVQMPAGLLHVEDVDLDGASIDPGLLATFRAYLPHAVEDVAVSSRLPLALAREMSTAEPIFVPRRGLGGEGLTRLGLLILAPSSHGGHHLLMLLARRVGAALRDANIRLRDDGGDLTVGRQKLCYLPGEALGAALLAPDHRRALAREAACCIQDLEAACSPGQHAPASSWPDALRSLLDQRLMAGRPTFLQAAPHSLPRGLEAELRARLPVLEAGVVQA